MIIIDREPWPPVTVLTSLLPIVLFLFNTKISASDFSKLWLATVLTAIILFTFYLNAIFVCSKKHDYISNLKPKADSYDEICNQKVRQSILPNKDQNISITINNSDNKTNEIKKEDHNK